MTREEAISILDPETRRKTLKKIPVFDRINVDQEACRIAVAALRAQQESNEPLTLDELRGMATQWVWVVVNYEHDGEQFKTDGWGLVCTPAFVAYLDQLLPTDFYGRKFVAYRRKLEDERR